MDFDKAKATLDTLFGVLQKPASKRCFNIFIGTALEYSSIRTHKAS